MQMSGHGCVLTKLCRKTGSEEDHQERRRSSKKQESSRKTSTFALLTTPKPLTVWITTKCGKFLKRWEYPRNLYAGQEATVSTAHGTMDWFKLGKRALQGCILSPCLFNSHAESTMRNAGLDDSQAGIKFARRNSNNLRYADGTTLMAESKEKVNSLLTRVKEENEKAGLKLNFENN